MNYHVLAESLIDLQESLHPSALNRGMSGLDKGSFFALNYLMAHGKKAYPKELSRKMAVSSARIAALLNHLEAMELIERTPDPQDCRQTIVSITDKGLSFIRQKRSQVVAMLTDLLEQLGPEDAAEYLRITRRIICIACQNQQQLHP